MNRCKKLAAWIVARFLLFAINTSALAADTGFSDVPANA